MSDDWLQRAQPFIHQWNDLVDERNALLAERKALRAKNKALRAKNAALREIAVAVASASLDNRHETESSYLCFDNEILARFWQDKARVVLGMQLSPDQSG